MKQNKNKKEVCVYFIHRVAFCIQNLLISKTNIELIINIRLRGGFVPQYNKEEYFKIHIDYGQLKAIQNMQI